MSKNKISLLDIKDAYEDIHDLKEYELKDGKILSFYPIFADTKINKMISEYAENLVEASKRGIELDNLMLIQLLNFYIVKEFTELGEQLSDKFEEQLTQYEWLVDSGYFVEIVEAFNKDEIAKVYKKVDETLKTYEMLNEFAGKLPVNPKDTVHPANKRRRPKGK